MLAVTKIVIEKHCDKVSLRSHMLTVLSPLNSMDQNFKFVEVPTILDSFSCGSQYHKHTFRGEW